MPSLSRSTKILAAGLTGALMFGGVAAAVGGSRPSTSRHALVATEDDAVTDPSVEAATSEEPMSDDPTTEEPAAGDPNEGEDEEAPPADGIQCPADVKNHGQFVSRVARAHRADETVDVRTAAHSDCGKKVKEEEPVADEPVTEDPGAGEETDDDAVEDTDEPDVTTTKAPKDNGKGTGNGQGQGNGKGNGGGNGKGKAKGGKG